MDNSLKKSQYEEMCAEHRNNKKEYDMPSVMNVCKLHPPKEWTGPVLCRWNECLGRCLRFKSQKFIF